MSKKYIVAGNWKMNGSKETVYDLILKIKSGVENIQNVQWIVFPPYIFLDRTAESLKDSSVKFGGQDLSDQVSGAYTGEISAGMLKDFGCSYVLIGHSERRIIHKENNELIKRKFKVALDANLIPILCVGETLEQREKSLTWDVISNQIDYILNFDKLSALSEFIIAYEPVWAIGTGVTATPEQAQEIHKKIRSYIESKSSALAQNLKVLYGGSVKPSNAKELFAMPDIDGGLIGGASLISDDFLNIGRACNN